MKALFVAALCISLIFYAGKTFAESEEICCTWINTEYTSDSRPQKIEFHIDGTFAAYKTKPSADATQRGTFQIIKKWKDSEENIWYQIKMENPITGTKYKLARVKKSGDRLEFVCNSEKFPTEIEKKNPDYSNYVRASID
jgi:hypothetical protein